MSSRACLSSLLLIVATLGCKPRPVTVDAVRVGSVVERRAASASEKPAAKGGFERLATEVFADREVAKAGEGLLATLGADAELKTSFDAIVGKLGEHPAVRRVVAKIIHDNPGISAEKVGEIAEQRIGAIMDSPAFDRAFDAAWERLMAKPDVAAAFDRLGSTIAESSALTTTLHDAIDRRIREESLRKRLVELNGGDVPSEERATEILLDRAFSEERLAGFYADLAALPVMKRELTTALREVAASPAFARYTTNAVRTIVADPAFRDRAIEAIALFMGDGAKEDEMRAALDNVLDLPVVSRALTGLIDPVLADPSLGEIGRRALARIVADPALQASVTKLCSDW